MDTLTGTLTNGQLVRGALDGDLTLNQNGAIVLKNGDSYANTDEEERITARWTFGVNVDIAGNLNMVSDTPGTVVGLDEPTKAGHAVPLGFLRSYVRDNAITGTGGSYEPPFNLNTNNPAAGTDLMWVLRNRDGAELFSIRNTTGDMRASSEHFRLGWDANSPAGAGTKYGFGNQAAGVEYAADGGILARDDNNNTTRLI